jgi:hypothetical protein
MAGSNGRRIPSLPHAPSSLGAQLRGRGGALLFSQKRSYWHYGRSNAILQKTRMQEEKLLHFCMSFFLLSGSWPGGARPPGPIAS